METHSDWYHRTTRDIESQKTILSQKEVKKCKLDPLLRLAGRVDSFTATCGECPNFQAEITRLTTSLGDVLLLSKEERKSYSRSINKIIKHLQKEHKLITEGYYAGTGIAIGTGIGTALGAGTNNPGVGLPIGIGIGLVIGCGM